MKNFLSRKRSEEFAIYLPSSEFEDEESNSVGEAVETKQISFLEFDKETGLIIFPPKLGPDEDPTYYVHPKHWYKMDDDECGQGYRLAVNTYYDNLGELWGERVLKLKAKLPLIGSLMAIGAIVSAILYKILK